MRFIQIHSIINDEIYYTCNINPDHVVSFTVYDTRLSETSEKLKDKKGNEVDCMVLKITTVCHCENFYYTDEKYLITTMNNLNFFRSESLSQTNMPTNI